jgi:hypothetical protein
MAPSVLRFLLAAVAAAAILPTAAHAHGGSSESAALAVPLQAVPSSLAVRGPLAPPPADVTELKFGEMVKMPIGPKGLEPTDKLLNLQHKRVRMVGFMAKQDAATPGMLVFTPMPLALGAEDESLSDDLPGNAVFVHLNNAQTVPPYLPGLIQLTGVLEVGAKEESDGHVSSYRLLLDADVTREIVVLSRVFQMKPILNAQNAATPRIAQEQR